MVTFRASSVLYLSESNKTHTLHGDSGAHVLLEAKFEMTFSMLACYMRKHLLKCVPAGIAAIGARSEDIPANDDI